MSRRMLFTVLAVLLMVSLFVVPAGAQSANPVQAAAEKYFTAGAKTIKAADLFANLNDGDDSNNPLVVDLRAAEDYANGHIPGSVNMGAAKLMTAEELAKLPKDRPIVAACYSGQNSAQVTAALRLMGYDAYSLTYGVPSWGVNDKVKYSFSPAQSGNYPVTKDAAQLEGSNAAPKPLADTVDAAAITYFAGGPKMIKAADVFANINDGDDSNNPVLVDIRSADDYALGHVAGAANVAPKSLFTAETLAKLPTDKQVVVYCYTGQTSGQVVAALRMLGYDATSMTYGLPSWAVVEGVSVPVWDNSKSGNYTLEGAPVAAAAAAPAPAAAAAPATMPTTGASLVSLLLAGLGLAGAGLALRRR